MPSPSPVVHPLVGWSYALLDAVAIVGLDDVWAVGEVTNVAPDGPSNALIEH